MYLHVSRFSDVFYLIQVVQSYSLAEIEDDHDGVTLESLHEIVKDQGELSCPCLYTVRRFYNP